MKTNRPTPSLQPSVTRELPLTREQVTLFTNLQAALASAQAQLNIAASAVCAGHGIGAGAQTTGIGGTPDKPTLTVLVPA